MERKCEWSPLVTEKDTDAVPKQPHEPPLKGNRVEENDPIATCAPTVSCSLLPPLPFSPCTPTAMQIPAVLPPTTTSTTPFGPARRSGSRSPSSSCSTDSVTSSSSFSSWDEWSASPSQAVTHSSFFSFGREENPSSTKSEQQAYWDAFCAMLRDPQTMQEDHTRKEEDGTKNRVPEDISHREDRSLPASWGRPCNEGEGTARTRTRLLRWNPYRGPPRSATLQEDNRRSQWAEFRSWAPRCSLFLQGIPLRAGGPPLGRHCVPPLPSCPPSVSTERDNGTDSKKSPPGVTHPSACYIPSPLAMMSLEVRGDPLVPCPVAKAVVPHAASMGEEGTSTGVLDGSAREEILYAHGRSPTTVYARDGPSSRDRATDGVHRPSSSSDGTEDASLSTTSFSSFSSIDDGEQEAEMDGHHHHSPPRVTSHRMPPHPSAGGRPHPTTSSFSFPHTTGGKNERKKKKKRRVRRGRGERNTGVAAMRKAIQDAVFTAIWEDVILPFYDRGSPLPFSASSPPTSSSPSSTSSSSSSLVGWSDRTHWTELQRAETCHRPDGEGGKAPHSDGEGQRSVDGRPALPKKAEKDVWHDATKDAQLSGIEGREREEMARHHPTPSVSPTPKKVSSSSPSFCSPRGGVLPPLQVPPPPTTVVSLRPSSIVASPFGTPLPHPPSPLSPVWLPTPPPLIHPPLFLLPWQRGMVVPYTRSSSGAPCRTSSVALASSSPPHSSPSFSPWSRMSNALPSWRITASTIPPTIRSAPSLPRLVLPRRTKETKNGTPPQPPQEDGMASSTPEKTRFPTTWPTGNDHRKTLANEGTSSTIGKKV